MFHCYAQVDRLSDALRRHVVTAATFSIAMIVPASICPADIINSQWAGPNFGNWSVDTHWLPVVVPNNGGGSLFDVLIASGHTVNVNQTATISNLAIASNDHLRLLSGNTLYISGADGGGLINNTGLIEVASTGSTTRFRTTDGPVTLTGGGTVRMSDNSNNDLLAETPFINVDHVIEGSGQLWLWDDFTNQHLIVANQPTPFRINASTLFTNEGTLRAEDGAALRFMSASPFDNALGVIEALDNSTVEFNSHATIMGGMLRTEGSGAVIVTSGQPKLDHVDISEAAYIRINNSNTLFVAGPLHNTGLIELQTGGSTTSFRPTDAPVTMTGGGTIFMGNSANNRILASSPFINVDNVIEGGGELRFDNDVTNMHLMVGNQTTPLELNPSSSLGFVNQGILRAQDGAELRFTTATTHENDGGIIEALHNSTVRFNTHSIIKNGAIRTEGSGQIVVGNGQPLFDHVDISEAAYIRVNNSNMLRVAGPVENTGLIEIAGAGSTTEFRPVDSPVTLTGGGTIRFSNSSSNRLLSSTPFMNVDNIIEGAGELRFDHDFTNQHLIIANQSNALRINPSSSASASFLNEGTMRAEKGATLRLTSSGTYGNTGGIIEALDDSLVQITTASDIVGGTLRTEGTGLIEVTATNASINDIALDGHLRINNNVVLWCSGTIHNAGLIEINSTGGTTFLRMSEGPVTLSGGGTIMLSDHPNNFMPRAESDALSHWINEDNTIRGAGEIGWTLRRTGMINHGSIIADGVNLLDIVPEGVIGFQNHGLLHAFGAGGARINAGEINQMGTVLIDEDSSLTRTTNDYLQSAGITTVNGILTISGSGNRLQLEGGILNGNGIIDGDVNNTAGNVSPGMSIGILTVIGDYSQGSNGRLTIEISGPEAIDDYDALDILGDAQLGGRLAPIFDEKYEPEVGTLWTFLNADWVSGTFSIVSPCEMIRVVYGDEEVSLEWTGILKQGDFNCDGIVDGADLLILLSAWGECDDPADCTADINGDGVVDGADLLILLSSWG